ncbi:MAG: Nif3-like dinuclear metal center hexameric protein [Chthonomonadales bacterium]
MLLNDLTHYLDEYLSTNEFTDYPGAYNGLQVEGTRNIRRIALAVDACTFTVEAAIAADADLVLVHHGLFWGWNPPITGRKFDRIAPLIRAGVALYSSHLPLDAHPEVGNNHILARLLGLTVTGSFENRYEKPIGVVCQSEISRTELMNRITGWLGKEPWSALCGPETVTSVGIITGGAGSSIAAAKIAGCDFFITGEGAQHTYFDAEELSMNVVYAGHYATETVGVQALGEHLTQQFGVECFFIDHPTGL